MKVILFGATGMVGQGVLRECLLDPGVESVLAVGRSPTGQQHAKLREIVHGDFTDFSAIESELSGYDACFFCLGVSSVGMDAERYRHLTYDITMAAATTLVKAQSRHGVHLRHRPRHRLHRAGPADVGAGQGQDRERSAQAAVQGRLHVPPRRHPAAARRAVEDRLVSRRSTWWPAPLLSYLARVAPKYMTTTEQLGRAMIKVARDGYPKPILESEDINAI